MTYRRSVIGMGLGQDKTGKTGAAPDQTWGHVAQMTTAGGGVVSAIIGAATGQPQPVATQTPIFDPNQAYIPPSTTPDWLVPTVVIGGGVLIIGALAYSVSGKKAVVANRRRRMRRNRRRSRR